MKKQNDNYFLLGLFVLAGIGILIALTLVFGAGKFNKKTAIIETYVTGSVTGLEVGAPARYRGVKIGSVIEIDLSGNLYEYNKPIAQRKQYVVIRIEVPLNKDELTSDIDEMVRKNLRARVKSAGITGVNYIDFDSSSEANNYTELEYDWKPKYPVVPSLPSQVDIVFAGINKALSATEDLDIARVQENIIKLLTSLNTVIVGNGKDVRGINQSIRDLDQLILQLNKVASNKDLDIITQQASSSAVALRQKLNSIEGDTQLSIEQIKQTSEQMNDLSRSLSRNPSVLVLGSPPAKIQLPEVSAP
jgi:phospholipid/cholesterol/gamma-HCH transport system substrate-binding protein/paraquat-inducible protein B